MDRETQNKLEEEIKKIAYDLFINPREVVADKVYLDIIISITKKQLSSQLEEVDKEHKKDLVFLKEMKQRIDKIMDKGCDRVEAEYLQKMIEDWIDELE